MSRRLLSLTAVAAALLAASVHAAPPARHEPRAAAAGFNPDFPSQAVAEGAVKRLLINPYGDVDGLQLADGTLVRLPVHMSVALKAAIKPGDTVRVVGHTSPRGMARADAVVNTTSGQTVYDQPPVPGQSGQLRPLPPHLRAAQLQPQRVEGRVETLLTGPRGEADGVILTDGTIVRFPPDGLLVPAQPGAPFAAYGLGTRGELGTSLEALSLGTTLSTLQPLYATLL